MSAGDPILGGGGAQRAARPRPARIFPKAYRSPLPPAPIDLWLAGNEGRTEYPLPEIPSAELSPYPSAARLEALLAERFGLAPEQVLVTAGADDALLRIALGYCAEKRSMVLPEPTFEMIPRYVALAGGVVRSVPWNGPDWPVDAVIGAAGRDAAAIAVVSPNNPTGAVVTPEQLRRVCESCPGSLVVVDAAYGEFAEEDLTAQALTLPNAVVLRTFSKAYGAAGLRLGYAMGPAELIAPLRSAGNPYPVSAPSLAWATQRLADPAGDGDSKVAATVASVRAARDRISRLLQEVGMQVAPSEANFVLARCQDPEQFRGMLAGLGIAVRTWPERAGLQDAARITVPADRDEQGRLEQALRIVLQPEAILFDMDGVLADVSGSYRATILQTARDFGVPLEAADIAAAKAEGDANDDWRLTWQLIQRAGVQCTLEEVTARFEAIYQGTDERPGRRATERLMVSRDKLTAWRERFALGVVTGRPRSDAVRFLEEQGIADLFDAVVCREDATLKPDPTPVRLAMEQLGLTRAWMVGDTPDDVRAARAAGVLPIGVLPPGDGTPEESKDALHRSGAGLVLDRMEQLENLR